MHDKVVVMRSVLKAVSCSKIAEYNKMRTLMVKYSLLKMNAYSTRMKNE